MKTPNLDALERRFRLGLSRELGILENLRIWRAALTRQTFVADGKITRADLLQVPLFVLPAGVELHTLSIWSPAGSDATTAVISVGTLADSGRALDRIDVRAVAGAGQITPRALRFHGATGSEPIDVVGRYEETGASSTTGGPWTVTALFSRRE